METPVAIIDTVWEPHTSTVHDKQFLHHISDSHHRNHVSNLTHSIHTHLPWHQNAHGTQPLVCPETDIGETAQSYHIEMALPGVTNKEEISIQWPSNHTLVVKGVVMTGEDQIKHKNNPIARTDSNSTFEKLLKKVSDSGHLNQRNKQDLSGVENGSNGSAKGVAEGSLMYILKERKLGVFQRSFTLPLEVISDGCRVKLEHGLLKLDVPKVVQEKQEECLTLDDT